MANKPDDTNGAGGLGAGGLKSLLSELPFDRLKDEMKDAFGAMSEKAVENAGNRITGATDKLTNFSEGGGSKVVGKAAEEGGKAAAAGESPAKGAVKGGLVGLKDKAKEAVGMGGSGGGGGSKATKATNIIESIDVGVPISVAYNQWTQFQDFSGFMKKVDNVEQKDEVKVDFKAQVFWSHRTWEATITEQVPDDRIVWRSSGEKGHVDGAVTFHELAPRLTRILVVLEYYPQGLFERTGNIWRAPGRRARLELKHFRRHVMTQTILEPDELEGWRGEIHDKEVTRSHEEVVEEEQQAAEDSAEDEDATGDEDEDAEVDEDEDAEGEEDEDADVEDEYEEEEEEPDEDADAEDEYEEDEPDEEDAEAEEEPEDKPAPRRRRQRSSR